jgi:hypothetical protein
LIQAIQHEIQPAWDGGFQWQDGREEGKEDEDILVICARLGIDDLSLGKSAMPSVATSSYTSELTPL